ncbi:ricin-type beta-trefoil lectin domain protein [Streptomyces sp. NPDC059582]|uniref:ricin-type beta-trefoil lectin domain protein n=1 Tax=Streptomyces sp. NPDC059582 TaxID=3346875 RepID=UPI0036C3738F
MPPLRKPRPSADRTGTPAARFTDTFAQRPAVPRRGLVPGVRVWATVGATAGLTVVSVLAFPLLARVDLFPDGDASPAAAVAAQQATPGPAASSASPTPNRPGNPSPDSAHSAGGTGNNAAGAGGSAAGGPVGSGGSAGGTAQQPSGGGGTQSGTGGQSGGTGTGKTADPKPADTGKSGGTSSGSGTTTATVPGTLLIGSASGRCVDVSNANNGVGKDGTRLQIWDCGGAANQKWVFRSDGTVRSLGMCMDVAWGSTTNGAAIQLAKCSGNRAQLFYLSTAGDLVSSLADKCVDIVDNSTGNGAKLQLWTCSGTANQKWRKG